MEIKEESQMEDKKESQMEDKEEEIREFYNRMFRPELMPLKKAMHLVEREEWHSVPPKYRFKVERPAKSIILRYTGTATCKDDETCNTAVLDMQKVHMVTNNMPDILYNFMVGGNGKVYEGTGWKFTTNKNDPKYYEHDFINLDIAYIAKNKDEVTAEMRWAVRKILQHGIMLNFIATKPKFLGDEEAISLLET